MAGKKRPVSIVKPAGLLPADPIDRPATSMFRVTYRCAFDHEHFVTLPDPPETLDQLHGRYPGGIPQCHNQLKLAKKELIV